MVHMHSAVTHHSNSMLAVTAHFGLHANKLQLLLSSAVHMAACQQAPHPGLDLDGCFLLR